MLSYGDLLPCLPETDETELALDMLDTLGLIVADETRISMVNWS